jgi:hypothetical protein
MLKNATKIMSSGLGAIILVGNFSGIPAPAKADTTSTVLIAAGAAAIVGALLYDSSSHPYYVRDNQRYYVTHNEALYYRSHHRGYERRAYVPEQEYPVARNPYHGNWQNSNQDSHYDNRDNQNRDHNRQN